MKNKSFLMPVLYILFSLTFILFPAQSSEAQTGANRNARVEISELPVSTLPVWERDLEGSVSGELFLQAESAVIAVNEGIIRSYSIYGTHLWDFDPRGSVTPYVRRNPEGASYVCNTSGSFMAVNRVGRELWRVDLGQPISFPAVVGWDGRVFITAGSDISCRTGSGNPLWNYNMGSRIVLAPVLDRSGGIVTVLENRELLRLSQFGAQERIALNQLPSQIIPLKSENEYSFYLLYGDGSAERIVFDDSQPKGSQLSRASRPSMASVPVAAAGFNDQIAVAFRDGRVQLVSSEGRILWTGYSHESSAEKGAASLTASQASMVFDERGVYLLSVRGVSAFAANGRRRWMHKIDETMTVPGLSDEGLIYACGKDGILRMYKADVKPRGRPRSMFGPAPEGRYGLDDPPPSPWGSDTFRYNEHSINDMIETIDRVTMSGDIGELEPLYVAYIIEMTYDFLNNPHYSQVRPPVHVPARVKLIQLLARMGSRETVSFLTALFYRDPEPSIKAACCEAIGRIGVDPEGKAYGTFSFLLSPNNANRDPMTLMAAISSVAALCRFSGPPLSDAGIRLLYTFSRMDYPPAVKRQVQAELDALRRDGLDKPLR